MGRRTASLPDRQSWNLLPVHDRPALTVEALQFHGVDAADVVGRGIDHRRGQQHWQLQAPHTLCLAIDILARETIAALPQHVGQKLRGRITPDNQDVARIGVRVPPFWSRPDIRSRRHRSSLQDCLGP